MAVLTAAALNKLKPGPKRRLVKDGGGQSLYVLIQPSGHKAWVMRFRRPGGAPAKLTLGPIDFSGKELNGSPVIGQPLTISAARQVAAAVHRQRAMGADVFSEHAATKHRQGTSTHTFGVLARQFIEEHARPKTRRWRETARVLGLFYPLDNGMPKSTEGGLAIRWADRQVSEIDSHAIHFVIAEATRFGVPGRGRKTKGLSPARGRSTARALSKFFSWLIQNRLINVNPCLGVYVPPPPAARERVLTDAEIRLVWLACEKIGAPFGPIVQLLLLTGQRRDEVARMQRDELASGLWTLSSSRTKNKRSHVVPLSRLASQIIEAVPKADACKFVFSWNGVRPVSGWSKAKGALDRAMLAIAREEDESATIMPWRLHDLRRTAVTRLIDLGVQPHVVEAVVNHISGYRSGVAGVYNRSELLPERRHALTRWAEYIDCIAVQPRSKVASVAARNEIKLRNIVAQFELKY